MIFFFFYVISWYFMSHFQAKNEYLKSAFINAELSIGIWKQKKIYPYLGDLMKEIKNYNALLKDKCKLRILFDLTEEFVKPVFI